MHRIGQCCDCAHMNNILAFIEEMQILQLIKAPLRSRTKFYNITSS